MIEIYKFYNRKSIISVPLKWLSPKSQLKSLPIIGEDFKASNDALVGLQQKLLALEFFYIPKIRR